MLVFIMTLTFIPMPHSLDYSKGPSLRTVSSLYLWFSVQYFAITGILLKLSQNLHWIINKILLNGGNYLIPNKTF